MGQRAKMAARRQVHFAAVFSYDPQPDPHRQGGAKKEVCFELFLKKSSFQLLSHKKARLWGYSRKNYKVKCIFESLSKAPQSLTATCWAKKRQQTLKSSHPSTATFRLRNGQGIREFFSTTLLRHKCGKTKPMLGKKAYP